ncbi:DICT sensory domain-containing protein [Gloeocapsa sp. PCC 73106]|uniref:DICT sensory domain-containing protein n=1 Tax=Gloeocapsa sp. PCC 73106 TaxID=102232 RepID=UPI0002AD0F6C|nr:DICT sensory domain-containing protein [Gloeocapsa sp. PCC 73106]ELR96371.1 putative sensor protein [Gloeocapsa sp. PCC 73106]
MIILQSVLKELLEALTGLKTQMYFKSSLTALSHAMEDQILAESMLNSAPPLVIASFQRERFYRQEAHRYKRLAQKTDQVYVLAAPETSFSNYSDVYEQVAFAPQDGLAQEWHLVIITDQYSSCLVCRERQTSSKELDAANIDNSRRFEGIWSLDRQVAQTAASILLKRILKYRPQLAEKIKRAEQRYIDPVETGISPVKAQIDPFVRRLVTYLQASQYKLLKSNRSLALKETKERLLNSIIGAIRRSLDSEEILQVAVKNLGEGLGVCRCIVYRCKENDTSTQIYHEFTNPGAKSVKGKTWPLRNNPLFQEVIELRDSLSIEDTSKDPRIQTSNVPGVEQNSLQNIVKSCSIFSWLLIPLVYQDRLLGMMELHHCGPEPTSWKPEDISLVDAIANQISVALIQAEAYANLEDLNQQLEALDRTRSNLVAITGHELRTPLSTIQICLESLASEPDMSLELRQIMLNTALQDAERMRKLVQDFLTLSQLESGRVECNPEPLSLAECVDLSLSHLRSRINMGGLPQITNLVTSDLPLVQVDGEWLVEVLAKLLDNACKFTGSDGQVTIRVSRYNPQSLEVIVSDTGRGIEPNRLNQVFDRFYQEEGALRRSVGGTGLGLAICRQIVANWGGQIWAKSQGKNQGSEFHFTLPIFEANPSDSSNAFNPPAKKTRNNSKKKQKTSNS